MDSIQRGRVVGVPLLVVAAFTGLARADPPAITSLDPSNFVQGTVPQPDLVLTGTNFVVGIPSETNRPTVTLRQDGVAELSAPAFVNFSGTTVTVPSTELNLLLLPLGVYDVIVTRPDGESHTLPAAFEILSTPESDGTDLKVLSVWGGPVNDVEVVGNLAYVAVGRRLVILDLTDPGDPVEIGSLTIMPGVEGVAVRNGYAFLGAHKPHRFCVADVSDPSDPTLVWASSVGQTFPNDVHLYGNLAYVRETGGIVEIFDVTDPLSVVNLGTSPVTTAEALTIVGDLLYVADETPEGMLNIYDLSADPFNPALLGSVDTGGRITRGLVVDGNYAYVAALNDPPAPNSLYVVDVSDPSLPVVVGSDDGFVISEPTDVAVRDGFAYVADSAAPLEWALSEGLVILDVSNPANPMRVGNFKTHGNIQRIEIINDRAYLSDDGEGLIILDLTSPTNPVRLGNYHSPAALRQMAKAGDLLFVADTWNGFTVLDVSNPASPDVVGVYLAEHIDFVDPILGVERPLGIDAWGIAVKDDRVYLGAGQLGLEVVDVGDPTSPALLGAFRIPLPAFPIWDGSQVSRFRAVTVSGDVAHIGFRAWECDPICGSAGYFLNVDVSDPQGIFELGREQTGVGSASKIEVNGQGFAFIGRASDTTSGGSGGQQLTIDTFDPQIPETVYWGVDSASDVSLVGTTLYITEDNSSGTPEQGLWVQDVTDPVNPDVPVLVNETTPLAGGVVLREGFAVAATNRRVYVAGRGTVPGAGGVSALYLLDTTEPTAPALLDIAQPVGGTRSSVYVDEPSVFVTNVFVGPSVPSIGLVVLEGMNPADLDGDGTVGIIDFLMLLGSWGPCPGPCSPGCLGDLDGDCNVGITDLLALLGNWG